MARNRIEIEENDPAMEQFRAFLDELVKAQKRFSEAAETDADEAAQGMSRHLLNVLEIQTLQSRRDSTRFDIENIADARYLKAVLADELLLNGNWAGRERWTSTLLESTLFRTNIAGDLVFKKIEALLSDREPSRREMARLYLFALAMGFQGRFRGGGDEAQARLRSYREELYEFIYQRRADLGELRHRGLGGPRSGGGGVGLYEHALAYRAAQVAEREPLERHGVARRRRVAGYLGDLVAVAIVARPPGAARRHCRGSEFMSALHRQVIAGAPC